MYIVRMYIGLALLVIPCTCARGKIVGHKKTGFTMLYDTAHKYHVLLAIMLAAGNNNDIFSAHEHNWASCKHISTRHWIVDSGPGIGS